ncbi:MAG: tyrosine-type recombinase/integrase [Candidatus Nanohaloarchaea archaeon]
MAGKTYEKQIEKIVNGDGCHANLADDHLGLIQDWRNQLELDGKSAATQADYLSKTSHFLRHEDVQGMDLDEIGRSEVNAYLSERGNVYTYKAPLRQFFLWYYLDRKQVGEDELPRFVEKDLKDAPPRKGKVKAEDVPKEDEVKALLAAARNRRDKALIALLADKGMRISEALSLDLGDVNRDKAGIYLMVPEAKKQYESYRRNRLTFSRPALQDWLEEHPYTGDEDAPLFVAMQRRFECVDCGSDGNWREDECTECGGDIEVSRPRMGYSAARAVMNTLREEADVRDSITLHKFRHYSATNDLKDEHMKERYIVKEHGWDDPTMLDRYGHLTDDEVDKARIRQMVERGELSPDALPENGNGEDEVAVELIRCPNCHRENSPERDMCSTCNQPFTEDAAEEQERYEDLVDEVLDDLGFREEMRERMQEAAPQ